MKKRDFGSISLAEDKENIIKMPKLSTSLDSDSSSISPQKIWSKPVAVDVNVASVNERKSVDTINYSSISLAEDKENIIPTTMPKHSTSGDSDSLSISPQKTWSEPLAVDVNVANVNVRESVDTTNHSRISKVIKINDKKIGLILF